MIDSPTSTTQDGRGQLPKGRRDALLIAPTGSVGGALGCKEQRVTPRNGGSYLRSLVQFESQSSALQERQEHLPSQSSSLETQLLSLWVILLFT